MSVSEIRAALPLSCRKAKFSGHSYIFVEPLVDVDSPLNIDVVDLNVNVDIS